MAICPKAFWFGFLICSHLIIARHSHFLYIVGGVSVNLVWLLSVPMVRKCDIRIFLCSGKFSGFEIFQILWLLDVVFKGAPCTFLFLNFKIKPAPHVIPCQY
uniref:Uncharacterized protein n=1 Tax=Opuntia streptacantha TaxID=393608 RepID=A0A7C8Z9X4_OPUST